MCKGHPISVTICSNYVALLAIGSKMGKVHAERIHHNSVLSVVVMYDVYTALHVADADSR